MTTTATGTARRLRLWLGLAISVGVAFAPGLTRAEALTLSAAGLTYVLGATLFDAIAARRRGFPARILTPFLGLVVIEVVIVTAPRALAAGLVLFLLLVTFSTYVGGLRRGLYLSAVVVPFAVVANVLASEPERLDTSTLATFAVLVPFVALVTGRLTAERRRTTVALARLHDALDAAEAQPDLETTLDSIAMSVGHSVGATVVGVVLRDRDRVTVAHWTTVPSGLTPADAVRFTRAELELGPESPLGAGLRDRRPLIIPDFDDDPRFADWSSPWERVVRELGCRSLVLVPLRLGRDVIGAVVTAFTRTGPVPEDDLAFLEAYADRAATVAVRARAYDQERESAAQLAVADQQKSEFLAVVSHELRTPLTAVKGFVDTVLVHWDQLPEPRRRDLLSRASSNADELNRLVGQLLDFSRVDASRARMSPRLVQLPEAVARVLEDIAPVLADHHVEVDVGDDTAMFTDTAAFDQILTNLLTNAAKFSPSGSWIVVLAEPAGDEVVVSVTDAGVGIAPDEQERIFDRFYQSPSNELSRRGTGVGLTLAKSLIEMQGGRIRVESELGRGSTFAFVMPAAPPADQHEHTVRQEVAT
jgi:signal transduction histidine kinase